MAEAVKDKLDNGEWSGDFMESCVSVRTLCEMAMIGLGESVVNNAVNNGERRNGM